VTLTALVRLSYEARMTFTVVRARNASQTKTGRNSSWFFREGQKGAPHY